LSELADPEWQMSTTLTQSTNTLLHQICPPARTYFNKSIATAAAKTICPGLMQ